LRVVLVSETRSQITVADATGARRRGLFVTESERIGAREASAVYIAATPAEHRA
jgi:hypothetical protein